MPAPKRKRDLVGTRSRSKRNKDLLEAPCRILDLPLEILDVILEDVLSLPAFLNTGTFDDVTIGEILGHNFLRTCRLVRSRALSMITNRCVWIRIGCNMPDVWSAIRKKVAYAAVSQGWRQTLNEESLQTIDLFIGFGYVSATGDRCITSPRRSVLIAFSHHVWLRFLSDLQQMIHNWFYELRKAISDISLRCETSNTNMERILESHLLPSFLDLRKLYFVGIVGERLKNSKQAESLCPFMSTGFRSKPFIYLDDVRGILKRIFTWAFQDRDDAVIAALYSCSRFSLLARWYVHDYCNTNSREENQAISATGEICYMIGGMAGDFLLQLFQDKGVAWLKQHPDIIECGRRWIDVLMQMSFPIRHRHRGHLHRNIGQLTETLARTEAGLEYDDDDESMLTQNTVYARKIGEADRHFQVALLLLEGTDITEPIKDKARWIEETAVGNRVESQYVEFHNVRDTGYYWAGHKQTLYRAGGESLLRYLPLAKDSWYSLMVEEHAKEAELRNEDDDEIFDDESDIGPDPNGEVMYCDKSCKCIVF